MNTNYYNDLLSQRANVREQLNRLPSGAWMTKLSLEARLSGLQETINNLEAKGLFGFVIHFPAFNYNLFIIQSFYNLWIIKRISATIRAI